MCLTSGGDITLLGGDLFLNSGTSYNDKGVVYFSNERTAIISDIVNATANGDTSLDFQTRRTGATASALFIDEFRDIGISTTSPQAQLHINEDTSNSYATLRLEGANRGGIIEMYNQTSYPVSSWTTDQSGNIFFDTSGAFASTSLSTKFTILTGGNVGIGTTSPSRKLDVRDSSNTQSTLLAYNQGASFTGTVYEAITDRTASSDFNLMNLKSSTVSKFLVRGDGNVGIGTTDIEETLTIAKSDGGDGTIVGLRSDASFSQFELVTKNSQVDWGLQTIGARNIYFSTNGSERMRIDSSGNVTIQQDVGTIYNATANQTGGLFVNNIYHEALNTFSQIRLGVSGASGASSARIVAIEPGQARSDLAFVLRDGSGYNERLRIVGETGNVGIGTDSPSEILQTNKNSAGNIVGGYFTNSQANTGAESVSLAFGLNRSGGDFVRQTKAITFGAEQQWTGTPSTVKGYLSFSTILNETVAERMRISASGVLTVGGQTNTRIVTTITENDKVDLNVTDGNGSSTRNLTFSTAGTQRMRLTADGELKIGTGSGANGKLHVVNTDLNRKIIIEGNGTSQGFAHKATLVNHYPVVSTGSQLIIPFTSQGNLNSTTIIKIWGHSGRFNSSDPLGFEATIQLGHLQQLYNVSAISSSGNISGVSASGMNLVISFTTAYTNATADGIFATIEYMTNNLSYSLQPTNIVMN